jgi:hypothetical protein
VIEDMSPEESEDRPRVSLSLSDGSLVQGWTEEEEAGWRVEDDPEREDSPSWRDRPSLL